MFVPQDEQQEDGGKVEEEIGLVSFLTLGVVWEPLLHEVEDWEAMEGNGNSVVTVGVPVSLVFVQDLFLALWFGSSSDG